jgi:hypothetical protein
VYDSSGFLSSAYLISFARSYLRRYLNSKASEINKNICVQVHDYRIAFAEKDNNTNCNLHATFLFCVRSRLRTLSTLDYEEEPCSIRQLQSHRWHLQGSGKLFFRTEYQLN